MCVKREEEAPVCPFVWFRTLFLLHLLSPVIGKRLLSASHVWSRAFFLHCPLLSFLIGKRSLLPMCEKGARGLFICPFVWCKILFFHHHLLFLIWLLPQTPGGLACFPCLGHSLLSLTGLWRACSHPLLCVYESECVCVCMACTVMCSCCAGCLAFVTVLQSCWCFYILWSISRKVLAVALNIVPFLGLYILIL